MAANKWSQFFDFTDLDEKRMNGYCKLCRKNYKDRRGTFSNFVKHLKRTHPLDYEKIISNDPTYTIEEMNVVPDDQNQPSNTYTNLKQKKINLFYLLRKIL
jgi:hypothetical protein